MSTVRCLLVYRPFQHTKLRTARGATCISQLRLYTASRLHLDSHPAALLEAKPTNSPVQQRLHELRLPTTQLYPRVKLRGKVLTCKSFLDHYASLTPNQSNSSEVVLIYGRVNSFRLAGSRLFFVDLLQEAFRVQGVCNFRKLLENGVTEQDFRDCYHVLRRGDIMSMRGIPHRTNSGELSLLVSELPQLLSPCLHHLPTDLYDKEKRIRNRHVDFIVNTQTAEILRLRAGIVEYLRSYLLRDAYVEVQTPILADGAGGAVARPFVTSSTEFPNRRISLRIAPELWLKRLVIGGFDRVFEIGPSFRNEGLDTIHNPEFTTCEFYRAYSDIEELMGITENMLSSLAKHVKKMVEKDFVNLKRLILDFDAPYQRLDFVSGIETAINRKLPNLTLPDAQQKISRILQDCSIPLPAAPTLPHLLDKLSATFLEPRCVSPTFIINHPECMSPLSKSFDHPVNGQRVSARAELFVNCQEIVNTYEEENSPFEQRRKFIQQSEYHTEANHTNVDESYLEALEWGLPPTGGWGCGVDRLCMLMLGVDRIGHVLSFGTLRNVVNLNQGR